MVSTRSSSKTVESVVMVYPEATALRRFSARLNALLKAEDVQGQQQQKKQQKQMHSYNLRPRPAAGSVAVGPYNLRPRRHVCYVE